MSLIRVYLAGAIAGCTDEECSDWRQYVIDKWGRDQWSTDKTIYRATRFKFLNPLDRDFRSKHIGPEEEKLIVGLDKVDIQSSYAVIYNYDKPTVGTSMEAVYGHIWGKLGVLVCKTEKGLSPWWKYHVNQIVHNYEDAINYILEQHDGKK
jgi:hypothetical protein